MKSIRTQLLLAFLVVNLLALAIGGMGCFTVEKISGSIDLYKNQSNEIKDITTLIGMLEKMENSERRLIVDDRKNSIDDFERLVESTKKIEESIVRSGKSKGEQILLYLLKKELASYENNFKGKIVPEWEGYQQLVENQTANTLSDHGAVNGTDQIESYLYKTKIEALENESKSISNKIQKIVIQLEKMLEEKNDFVTMNLQRTVEVAKDMMIFTSIGALVLGFVLSIRYSNSLIRPIHHLVEIVGKAAEGNLMVRSSIHRKDELGLLSKGFNKMLEQMNRLTAEVKESVELIERVMKNLREDANKTLGASQQIAATIEQVAGGNEQSSEELVEINDKLSNIVEDLEGTKDDIDGVANLAHESNHSAQEGLETMEKTNEQMMVIQRVFGSALELMLALQEKNEQINHIARMIGDIGEHTNLLALNAAIEAARSGEAGKGFSVVAGEIRKLAGQSEAATQEIDQILKNIQEEIDNISILMQKGDREVKLGEVEINRAGERFGLIADSLAGFDERMESIVERSKAIKDHSNQVFEGVSNIVAVVEENTAGAQDISENTKEQITLAEDTAGACEDLYGKCSTLKELVNHFKTDEEELLG